MADDLADRGARVVVVGSGADDARAARALRAAVRRPVVDLVDRLGLPALTGLLADCSLVVANDSGPRHLAAAVGAPTVGVFLAPNALSAGPLTARRSRIAVSYRTRCPVCEQDQRDARCAHDASLVADVEVDEVLVPARELYEAADVRATEVPCGLPVVGGRVVAGTATLRTDLRRLAPLLLTGFGLGAFLDGIVLHQVLQWHHLVVARVPADDLAGLEANTLWDGVFHLVSWLVVVAGLVWVLRSRRALRPVPWRALTGALLAGWGAFNITDQVVFHLLLGAHHIRMVADYQVYDWGYTAIGAALVAGWSGARPRRPVSARDVSGDTSLKGMPAPAEGVAPDDQPPTDRPLTRRAPCRTSTAPPRSSPTPRRASRPQTCAAPRWPSAATPPTPRTPASCSPRSACSTSWAPGAASPADLASGRGQLLTLRSRTVTHDPLEHGSVAGRPG